ncbi:MAG: hypothetical protein ACXVJF_11025 [Acidimicrobiia bacterium]
MAASRRRFLDFYPDGFDDADYLALERSYKWEAHQRWTAELGREQFEARLATGDHEEVARTAIRIESRTNLLFSFEKIAVRDAIATPAGAKAFAAGLFELLHGAGRIRPRFERWCAALADLPRGRTRVCTWPVATAFAFIARPDRHLMLKPTVTRRAARSYGYDLVYRPSLQWTTYESLLGFAATVRDDLDDWRPRDMIDIQSFVWVLGSDEYD